MESQYFNSKPYSRYSAPLLPEVEMLPFFIMIYQDVF